MESSVKKNDLNIKIHNLIMSDFKTEYLNWTFKEREAFSELYLKSTRQFEPFKVIYKGKYNKLHNKIKELKNKRLGLSF
jgi:hypothetical protein